jgi:hypothetical protein
VHVGNVRKIFGYNLGKKMKYRKEKKLEINGANTAKKKELQNSLVKTA